MPTSVSQPRVFLTAEWRWLLMLNYAIDPAVLQPWLPNGVELDLWQGEALVSMVGFLFLGTRVLGVPVPFHRDFEEVNLRFYVRRETPEGWRRGVTFVREIVPRGAIAALARLLYNEPTSPCPMRHRLAPGACEYAWCFAGRWHSMGAEFEVNRLRSARAAPRSSSSSTIGAIPVSATEARLSIRSNIRAGGRGLPIMPRLDCDATALYGPQFVQPLAGVPVSAFLAEGSPISVRRGVRLVAEAPRGEPHAPSDGASPFEFCPARHSSLDTLALICSHLTL